MRAMRHADLLQALVLVTTAAACGSSRPALKLTLLDASVQRPSNIAVYFTVDTAKGDPVPGLAADAFHIYEDEGPVSTLESRQTILNPEVAATHYTLLLIDMSGSVAASADLPVVIQSARAFAERVQKYQKVAVYSFDGGAQIRQHSGFTTGPGLTAAIDRLGEVEPRDPSTNLNGAIIEAMEVLHRQTGSSSTPLTFGTLVVFTDGTDRAHRVPREKLYEELALVPFDVLVVGAGEEIDSGELGTIGRDGAILSTDRKQIGALFDRAAARVEAQSRRYYLLGYCSPSRAGEHDVKIEATVDGKRGDLVYHFNAQGFGPDCDPTRPPRFSVKRPRAPRRPVIEIEPAPSGGRF
jgi:hypothetical protein